MRYLIIGASGQLGQALCDHFRVEHEVIGVGSAKCPLEDGSQVLKRVVATQPQVVINTAALSDVDACEREPDRAMAINGDGARHVALACLQVGSRMVHISTDFVFDGKAGRPLDERDTPAPVNAYARSKLRGEQEVAAVDPTALICRVSCLLGNATRGVVPRLLAIAAQRQPLRVATDTLNNPTWTVNVAAQIAALLDAGERGLFHTASDGGCSRFDLMQFVIAQQGLAMELAPAHTADFPTDAPRPHDTRLRNRRLERTGLNRMLGWRDAVTAYLDTLSG